MKIQVTCLFWLLCLLGFVEAQGQRTDSGFFQDGQRLREHGDSERALEVWTKAKDVLDERGEVNPRLAFAFIELATEQNLEVYYQQASEMYFWGLSEKGFPLYQKSYTDEIERILPLLSADEQNAWRKLLKENDAAITHSVRQFWIERDPIPSTIMNERLLEHWKRIAYSRKNFHNSSSSIYGADDRGLIYVKYGAPDREREVTLGTNDTELLTYAELADFGGQNYSLLRNAMRSYLTYPECEVWVYNSLTTEEPVVFLFGPESGTGSFGLRDGVEDLIPNSSFSRRSLRDTGGLLPGSLLQLMYYGELSFLNASFEHRYADLESVWTRALMSAQRNSGLRPRLRTRLERELKGRRKEYKLRDIFDPLRKYATTERSDFAKKINSLELVAYDTRILDEQNQPRMVFIAFQFNRLFMKGRSLKFPSYDFQYRLIVRDDKMNTIENYSAEPVDAFSNTVVYQIPHKKSHSHYSVVLEAYLNESESVSSKRAQPISAGQRFFPGRAVLDSDPDQFEVSDVVLGINFPQASKKITLPFPIIPINQIFESDTLQVYMELYHLTLGASGKASYTADFRVTRLKPTEEGFEREEMLGTAFEFEAFAPTVKETFGINISKLKAGDYELSVEVSDKNAAEKKRRTRQFKIFEMN